jgi:ABC-type nitrate/sulfonate/bicarbonate transport system permease component
MVSPVARRVLPAQAALLGAALGVWVLLTGQEWVSPIMLAGPVAIVEAIRDGLAQGELLRALRVTLLELGVAFAIGGTAGLVVGLGGGIWRHGRDAVYPVLVSLSAVPVYILYPLFVVWFGMGQPSKYAFGAVYAFFPVALNAFAAVRGVDRMLLVKARALGAGPYQVYLKVVLPASLPTVVVGLRLGVSYAFVGIVATEMIAAFDGVGYLLGYYALLFQSGKTYGYILVALLFAFVLNATLRAIEARAGRWR